MIRSIANKQKREVLSGPTHTSGKLFKLAHIVIISFFSSPHLTHSSGVLFELVSLLQAFRGPTHWSLTVSRLAEGAVRTTPVQAQDGAAARRVSLSF